MTRSIVEARPGHAAFTAWVMLAAARSHLSKGLWDFFVDQGEAATRRFLEALAISATPHWAHRSTFLVAEVDGEPAAGLCGYFDEALGMPALQKGVAEADERLGRTQGESAAGIERIRPVFHVMPEHEPGTWIVENVATHPDHRRRGLVDALLDAMLERGRERGASRAGIAVLIGNDPAQRAYEKSGFQVVAEQRHPDFERIWRCPGIRKLTRPL